jgi:hypothetical protein
LLSTFAIVFHGLHEAGVSENRGENVYVIHFVWPIWNAQVAERERERERERDDLEIYTLVIITLESTKIFNLVQTHVGNRNVH